MRVERTKDEVGKYFDSMQEVIQLSAKEMFNMSRNGSRDLKYSQPTAWW